jgi:hypothetical protein
LEDQQTPKDYGENAAFISLTADDTSVLWQWLSFGGGNFEGAFAPSGTPGRSSGCKTAEVASIRLL